MGGFVTRDESVIPQKYHEPIRWASGGLDTAITDPPLCSVLQMGGGAVKARAAGVQGGIPAAGLEIKTLTFVLKTEISDIWQNRTHHTKTSKQTCNKERSCGYIQCMLKA